MTTATAPQDATIIAYPATSTDDVMSLTEIVGHLSDTTVGVSIHMSKWRTAKALSNSQAKKMADNFGADSHAVSGRKKLINTKNEIYRDVERVFNEAYDFWKFRTMPYPQHGVRLMSKNAVPEFRTAFIAYQNRLTIAVDDLERALPGLIEAQRSALGTLFSESDYPRSVQSLYELSYDVSDVNPPSYLAQLDPALFREQMERAQSRIQHAVSLLENEFLSEMQKCVESLVKGLSKTEGGKRKSLRQNSVKNLNEFFERVGSMNVNSSAQINSLVSRAREAMSGRSLSDLKTNDQVRDEVRGQFAELQSEVEKIIKTRVGRQFEVLDD